MYKPDRNWFIRATENFEVELTDTRRIKLVLKSELLYGKYCRLNGNGICAESFAEYHMLRGEYIVVSDFLNFLQNRLTTQTNPQIIKITQELIQRVEALLFEASIEAI